MLQDDMDEVAKRVEAGLENSDAPTSFSKEELVTMIRTVVKEELSIAVNYIKKYIGEISEVCMNNRMSNNATQSVVSSDGVRPSIEFSRKVAYDIRREANCALSMTCGGWTFFQNRKEGNHLWAVNENGSEYCELYPKTISRVEKIEEGYVYFTDAEYEHFRVCINSSKIENDMV